MKPISILSPDDQATTSYDRTKHLQMVFQILEANSRHIYDPKSKLANRGYQHEWEEFTLH